MAQFTQKAIMKTFQDMLEVLPFDKITVSALVKKCEISSNTFYYHYRDIYALLDGWLEMELSCYVPCKPPYEDWKGAAKAMLHDCKGHANVIYHIFNSLSRDRLERYMFTSTSDFIDTLIQLHTVGYDIPEERLQEIADFCRFALIGFFLKFLWTHMEDDIDSAVDHLGILFDGFVMQAAKECPEKEAKK
ncbi:MAG: TetR-like C-terminal domain-containing protein [Oscillospiraceae bacterium]|nr:TetR-like C-terminal domain-containing protein [Oscillospiraceae bacterium]